MGWIFGEIACRVAFYSNAKNNILIEKSTDEQSTIDYSFWLRAGYWTIEEGAALVLGINPVHVEILNNSTVGFDDDMYRKYQQLCELGIRAKKIGRIEEFPNPISYLEWVQAIDFSKIPEDLLVARANAIFNSPSRNLFRETAEPFSSIIDYKQSYEGLEKAYYGLLERLDERERELWEGQEIDSEMHLHLSGGKANVFEERQRKTMLKILLSVAVNKFRYNPNNKRSSTSKNMASTTDLCGLSVTDETIREHLKSAVAEYPQIRNLFEHKDLDE
ncbi:hypothetical protein RB2150_17664 [Rhodobacterales bacterium HTCC2150]|nr:hypothetical protein RB2150_17664 [Rhodobacterales bacterium HTCC2150] [Rhodobacteraceae bacterium HTCC2150]